MTIPVHVRRQSDISAALRWPVLGKPRVSIGTRKKRRRGNSSGVVVVHQHPDESDHEKASHMELARKIADLRMCQFAGVYDQKIRYPGAIYHVPGVTLIGTKAARKIGIIGERDLFGGVAPFDFVATKAIVHPLVAAEASAPPGWSHAFAEAVRPIVLAGYTAFTPQDALQGATLLLDRGEVRLKPVHALGGHGQIVVANGSELEAAIDRVGGTELAAGVVVEENLSNVTTYSIGRVSIGGMVATYSGTQHLTSDNAGAATYGGSSLLVARGGFEELLALHLTAQAQLAISQARDFDRAATQHFPELIASRRNYDVAQGLNADGEWKSGVLEQSWRIGGASAAEILALEALRADPQLAAVEAACFEIFGGTKSSPENAFVYFRGVDRNAGAMTKYALIQARHYAN